MRALLLSFFVTAMVAVAQTSSNAAAANQDVPAVFTANVADQVIGRVLNGLRVHSRSQMLSAFDNEKMDGYQSFADQIDSYFDRYDTFRVQFHIASMTIDGQRGIVLVDAEMEQTPAYGGA